MKFDVDSIQLAGICSHEHESILPPFMGTATARIHGSIATVGARFMDSTLKTLKASLEAIRDTALKALSQIEPQQDYSTRWKCKGCEYMKHSRHLFHWKPLADVPDA